MKLFLLIILTFICCAGVCFSQQNTMTKMQRWENSAFRVRTEHHRLMRLEITSDSLVINDYNFKNIRLTLLNKEGVIDVVLVNPNLVRMYYLDFVPLDYVEVMLAPFYGNPILGNIIELTYQSQEVIEVRNH
jgi:hypothetical protein